MKNTIRKLILLGVLCGLGFCVSKLFETKEQIQSLASFTPEINESEVVKVAAGYGKLPLHFEPNVGQVDDRVDFVSRGQGYALFLTDGEAVLALSSPSEDENNLSQSDVLRIQLVDANASSEVRGIEPLSGKSNYLLGKDASTWHTDVPHYGKVQYGDVYPGIDLVYYGTENRLLEHDFVVSPGANPDLIRFSIKGANRLVLNKSGNLIASTEGGDVILKTPVTYQDIDGTRVPIESRYALVNNVIGFELAAYDEAHTVVIDPVLSYSTYLGGSSIDDANAIAVDSSDNVFIVGNTLSSDFPLQSPFQAVSGGSFDVFVTVLNSTGSGLIYSTYLGGGSSDYGNGIAVDGSGNAFVTGRTASANFPLQSPLQATLSGSDDAFVSVLNNTGSGLIYSTYLGGSGYEEGFDIAVDGSGNAFVTGSTSSANFPLQSPFQATLSGSNDAFVSVINNTGSGLVYSTFLGGSSNDVGNGIVVDGSGQAFVTGSTFPSANFPLQSPFQVTHGGGTGDVFVSVFNSAGSGLIFSTYLGGSADDIGNDIAVDGSGNVFVIGQTFSGDFPLQSAFQTTHGSGTYDAFVSVFNSSGSGLVYSTYLGGSGFDYGKDIVVDGSGNAFVTGQTQSADFPLQSAFQATLSGSSDAFVSSLNNSGSGLLYSTYLGGSSLDDGHGIALDGSGNVFVVGQTQSTDFSLQSAFQATYGGGIRDAFVTKFSSSGLGISIPDTLATYNTQILVPIRIENPTSFDVVAAEISVAFDNSVVTLGSPNKTELTGTLVASGWSVEENVFSGVGGIDTLTIAMSTAADTLSSAGDLIHIVLNVADIRQPTSTALELVSVLFNDGTPLSDPTNGSLTVIGTDATVATSPDSIRPGETVSFTLDDVDLDLDVGSVDQVSVTAYSVTYGDSQSVTLTETGVNTGSFTGSVSTEFSAVAGTPQDGVIGTIAGDSIGVAIIEVLSSMGTTDPLYVTPVPVYGGVDGVVSVSYVVQALDGRNGVRDTVRVEVADADLDLDVGVANQVSATITNAISGESESLTLTETGVNTGVFQIRVPSIAGASGTNDDGVLSLASWDTLNVSYTDSLTAQGGVSPVGDITRVVNLFGDVQVNDNVQAFDAARLLAISVNLVSANTQTTLVGDVDGGGAIGAFDAALVLKYVVRLIDRFDVQTDFTADPKNHPFEKPVLSNVIALGAMEAQGDGTYLVPVQLAEREGVLSGTLTFGVDAGIEVVDVDLTNAYGSFMIAHNTTDEGVMVAFAGSQSELSGSGDVLMLRVRGVEGVPIRLSLDQVSLNGQSLTPSVNIEAMESIETPVSAFITELHQNLPNPFNPQTTIRYGLADAGQVSVVIYSVTGQRVRTLVSAFQAAGAYQVTWDGQDALGHQVSSGVYLMRMQTDGFIQTRKMMLLR